MLIFKKTAVFYNMEGWMKKYLSTATGALQVVEKTTRYSGLGHGQNII
jgi:hypothetical protein